MKHKPLENLNQTVKRLSECKSPEERIMLLFQAFEQFTEETNRLEQSYHQLREKLINANKELETSNQRLNDKVLELHVMTRYLDNILSHISQGLMFIDLNGTITTYNNAAEKILKKKKNEVIFNNFWDLFPDNFFGFSMKTALKTRKAPQATFASLKVDGNGKKEVEVENTFVVDKESGNELLDYTSGLIVMIKDITEIRNLQMVANRNDRMKELGEMAAQVAHEIRNPLGGIKGFAALLQRDLKNQPHLETMAAYIVKGADSLNRLVNNVLSYARPVQLHVEQTELQEMIHDLITHLKAELTESDGKVMIKTELPSESIYIAADSQLLTGAILNLIRNGIQAEAKEIFVGAKELTEEVQVWIRDNGSGILPENIEKIFSPFFTTKVSGNGFGLSEALKIVQAHGGSIEVESTIGQGTTVTIKFPLKI